MNQSEKHAQTKEAIADHWLSRGVATLVVFTGLALIATPANARWYKWVDESGNISYQDHPPPSSFEESSEVLNEHGVTLQTIPSKEEQKEIERQEKLLAEKRQRDDALVKAFPNEGDLITTRDKRIFHIDGSVARMHDRLIILNTRLASIEKRIDDRVKHRLAPSVPLESDRIAVIRSIDSTNALIKSKLRERRLVRAQFDRDLDRYREIKSGTATATLDQ